MCAARAACNALAPLKIGNVVASETPAINGKSNRQRRFCYYAKMRKKATTSKNKCQSIFIMLIKNRLARSIEVQNAYMASIASRLRENGLTAHHGKALMARETRRGTNSVLYSLPALAVHDGRPLSTGQSRYCAARMRPIIRTGVKPGGGMPLSRCMLRLLAALGSRKALYRKAGKIVCRANSPLQPRALT